MEPFTILTGVVAPLPAANVDTDVIMPKQYLKGVDRSGLAEGTFRDLRFDATGGENPDFVLNQAPWRNTKFLAVGPNFGCGSSREHAVWGLVQIGIRALIGTSFAGIFFDNCARNGLLAIQLSDDQINDLMVNAAAPETNRIVIDLAHQTIVFQSGNAISFAIESDRKYAILSGLDAIGVTLQSRDDIKAFEKSYFEDNPWLA